MNELIEYQEGNDTLEKTNKISLEIIKKEKYSNFEFQIKVTTEIIEYVAQLNLRNCIDNGLLYDNSYESSSSSDNDDEKKESSSLSKAMVKMIGKTIKKIIENKHYQAKLIHNYVRVSFELLNTKWMLVVPLNKFTKSYVNIENMDNKKMSVLVTELFNEINLLKKKMQKMEETSGETIPIFRKDFIESKYYKSSPFDFNFHYLEYTEEILQKIVKERKITVNTTPKHNMFCLVNGINNNSQISFLFNIDKQCSIYKKYGLDLIKSNNMYLLSGNIRLKPDSNIINQNNVVMLWSPKLKKKAKSNNFIIKFQRSKRQERCLRPTRPQKKINKKKAKRALSPYYLQNINAFYSVIYQLHINSQGLLTLNTIAKFEDGQKVDNTIFESEIDNTFKCEFIINCDHENNSLIFCDFPLYFY